MARCAEPDCFVIQGHAFHSSTPTELLAETCSLVDSLLAHDDCYLIVEAPSSHRYIQALATKGRLSVESVSNQSLGRSCADEHGLDPADHTHLVRLGWLPPDGHSPNWQRHVSEPWPWPASMVAELVVRTLVEVHRTSLDELAITLGHASRPERRPVEAIDT
jgi:hypothetical protein